MTRLQACDPILLQHATTTALIAMLLLAATTPVPEYARTRPPRRLRPPSGFRPSYRGKGPYSK